MGNNQLDVSHSFTSRGREGIEIEGVREVESFDERGVALDTACGNMALEGEGLRVTVLDISGGRVVVEGKIDGVYYFDRAQGGKRGLFFKRNS